MTSCKRDQNYLHNTFIATHHMLFFSVESLRPAGSFLVNVTLLRPGIAAWLTEADDFVQVDTSPAALAAVATATASCNRISRRLPRLATLATSDCWSMARGFLAWGSGVFLPEPPRPELDS